MPIQPNVLPPSRRTISVEAGAVWRDVTARAYRHGLVPPVLTNNLSVTVAGTLSVAGVGVASFKHGAQTDNVEELEETRRIYMKMTPGLPVVTVKSVENVIRDDKDLSGLGLKPEEMLDLSFLQKLEEERKGKGG